MLKAFIAVGLITGGAHLGTSRAGEDKSPPGGFHWQPVAELKARLAVPDGWGYTPVSSGEPFVLEVRPDGPRFKGSLSVFRLEAKRHTAVADVDARAYQFVQSSLAGVATQGPIEIKSLGVIYKYGGGGVRFDDKDGSARLFVGAVAAANRRTGTLYTMTFEIPSGEVGSVGFLATILLDSIVFDDGV